MIQRALISLSDKSHIIDFAKQIVDLGVEIISTGGTAKHLQEHCISVTSISDVTGFPEILNGRVKTLHPNIHGGILADRAKDDHMNILTEKGIKPIDMVIVNLYPFEGAISRGDATFAEAMENIDIGGPTMIRSAAKNHQSVIVIVDSGDYEKVWSELKETGDVSGETRIKLAQKAFAHTARYDAIISSYFNQTIGDALPETLNLSFKKVQNLRYGENSHQQAAFYGINNNFDVLHGKAISFNNMLDISTAVRMSHEFDAPAAILFKHTNPCGVAIGESLTQAFTKAFATDTQSPFGGIFAFNGTVDMDLVTEINKVFCDVIIAPDFSVEALEKLKKKKNRRLITFKPEISENYDFDIKRVIGGIQIQKFDDIVENSDDWKVVTQCQPSEGDWGALKFAWKVVKWTKSNAIVLADKMGTIGIGVGQTDRVGALEVALLKAEKFGHDIAQSVLASDAFFPFADSIELAAQKGVRAIIQPGGSIRDEQVIEAADKLGIPMVFTGIRHFRH